MDADFVSFLSVGVIGGFGLGLVVRFLSFGINFTRKLLQ